MPAGNDTIYNLAEKGVYNFSCDGTKIEFMSGTSVFMPYTFTDAVNVLGLLTTANLTVTGNPNFNGSVILGDGKEILRHSDAWLRINEDNDFSSGIYCGTSTLRTDGEFQVGSSGAYAKITSAGAVSSATLAVSTDKFTVDGSGNTAIAGTLTVTGEIRGLADVVAYYTSDKRMKDNIVNISDPLGKLKQIRGVYFDWNEKGPEWTKGWPGQPEGKIHDIGVIAQEVQKVLPEVVIERKGTGMLAVDYQKIVPLLIEGINEQQKHIELLQQRIEKLENK